MESTLAESLDLSTLHQVLLRSDGDESYLERRLPKIQELSKLLHEHFKRHASANSSTRALVFTQLRATVNEICSELAFVEGTVLRINCILCREHAFSVESFIVLIIFYMN